MMTLVIGGSASGKSEYAENLFCEQVQHAGEVQKKYYVATMIAYDQESKERVIKHRKHRAKRNMVTIEQPKEIEGCLDHVTDRSGCNIMVECVSNLVANEMFQGQEVDDEEILVKRVMDGFETLQKSCEQLLVVTNNVHEDGCDYDSVTRAYIHALGSVNQKLATMADQVIEVVYSIPNRLK